ncbi:MAG: phosphatase PAP2 family protein [Eubacterium sp.]|nr:phosphatase PAP2 family protein [Eubacterium sp.]
MIEAFDSCILDFFLSIRNDVVTPILKVITNLGELGLIWIILALCLLIKKETRIVGMMMLVSLLVEVIICNGCIKNIVCRPRPCWRNPAIDTIIYIPKDYSFPSGHSSAAISALVPLFYSGKKRLWIPGIVLAAIIICSRMYFYVHYPTDILVGMLVGAVVGIVVVIVFDKLYKKEGFRKKLRLTGPEET